MISIIVSSYRPDYFFQLEKNIQETIDVPYEIIRIDNPNLMSICEAYNKGIKLAQFDILCFSHEDICINTNAWGDVINEVINKKKFDIVGVAGSKYKTYMPSGWSYPSADMTYCVCMNLIQQFKNSDKENIHAYNNPDKSNLSQVACIDGFWFCVRKEVAEKLGFDQNMLLGFHGYDIDFSVRAFSTYKLAVTFDILIEHFSEGNFDKSWILDTKKLHDKLKGNLPAKTGNIPDDVLKKEEYIALYNYILLLKTFNLPVRTAIQYMLSDIKKTFRYLGFKNTVRTVRDIVLNRYTK